MYLTFSGKFINYVTFQSKTMSKLGSNSSAWRTIINFYSDKKVQKRMELLLSYRILWPSSTAYCRKCSVANALSVMKNNMGSSTILEANLKRGFNWEGSFWGNCDILTSAPLLWLEVEQVNFCTIIHCLELLTIRFSNLFLKRSPSQKWVAWKKRYIYCCYSKILASVLLREELLILLINLQMQNSWLQTKMIWLLKSLHTWKKLGQPNVTFSWKMFPTPADTD